MPKNSLNVSLKGADDIFSTEESRQEQQREQVQQIPIGELFPFKNHPFKVLDDESMQRTVESVEQYEKQNYWCLPELWEACRGARKGLVLREPGVPFRAVEG